MPEKNPNIGLYYIFIAIGAVVLILLIIKFAAFMNVFSRELRILNCEIARTTGSEQQYWIRKKRKLWLSLIPFVKY